MMRRLWVLGLVAAVVSGCTSKKSEPIATSFDASVPPPSVAPAATYLYDVNGDGTLEEIPFYRRPAEQSLGTQFGWHHDTFAYESAESYDTIVDNAYQTVTDAPLSTFSIDVDTASYSNVRRFLNDGTLPPANAVRVEELINYFDYAYAPPQSREPGETPFAAHIEAAECPWQPEHRLVKIGLKGWEIENTERPAANLVFLIDVSGSMAPENKLPLVTKSLEKLVRQLRADDRVAIAVYAGNSGLALPSTPVADRKTILRSLDKLESGGSTNGGEGIQLAYHVARQHFIQDGINRVILATDGDFNVGITDRGQLTQLIEAEAKSGVFLSVLGFGMGNLKDATLEELSGKGNGTYAYIDTEREADKIFVKQLTGSLVTIAKDVKIQVEFNPAQVSAYRLIGYENRILAAEDFNDDTKDAGEIGAGHTVTALYEVVPFGVAAERPEVDPLKYRPVPEPARPAAPDGLSDEMLTVKVRYKQPDGDTSTMLAFPFTDDGSTMKAASPDLRFAAGVAAFGMVLRDSPYKGDATMSLALDLAGSGFDNDRDGYRGEFMELAQKANQIMEQRAELIAPPPIR